MLLQDVGVNLLVVAPGIFFLTFSKWYVVGDASNSSVCLRIILSHFERDTDWPRCDAARLVKLDMPCANILFGFLPGISGVPSRLRSNATPGNERQYKTPQDFHLTCQHNWIVSPKARFFNVRRYSTVTITFLERSLLPVGHQPIC
jgi:hypothetical protein